ncbi:hypothetical protein CcaverHIS002_0605760 [Cutaneotrichosporon cavernicola]|uniref:Dol-P-Man:Man(5)GlcNAc(2)-PP-Dol alpha-1,3-mannosyltransferase n=1 Tax=Cutaneotrichosporon cavernicola TaxID=279322 RepID=A0AA48L901_9TREE|nr:uncharacterized protein CcaverHIS019_0605220 [Cutaneotrichosporon cavernicola]BEI86289.1 hypothetical protein CcaverHIS002_0605760 [Cutaneotrichosporon cavernicola]BEI94063.1 hypothetical protein CcaverHIS019_0605220 [Cutaneotrichosporon cavernicola]BEJ01842.1 hypothetical protein CcaverHIS631_0605240 [Cutaneotrichosporon cavernicola]BEJ09607.1 hypothetical protein CcaverHIS641_0605220 [Cutaneotrichosporon cavernicola]
MASALKLSPSLKALIKLPTARGAPTPSPGRSVLKGVFDRVKARGEAGGIGRDTWLSMNTSALFAINSPDALCALYDYSVGSEVNDRVQAAAVMRESGLKSISFTGIPKVINNLNALRDYLGEDVKAGLSTLPLRQPRDIAALYERGMGLWDGIYEPHSKKLVDKLGDSHPDLPVHILNSHYGPLLSDPEGPVPDGAFLLGRVLTSVIAIAGLRAQTGVGPQVTSHVFGLKKALLEGGGGDGKVLQGQEWLTSDEGVTWVIESVDEIGAVMRGDK